jgi:hypothetical protein
MKKIILVTALLVLAGCNNKKPVNVENEYIYSCVTPIGNLQVTGDKVKFKGDYIEITTSDADARVPFSDCVALRNK